MTVNEAFVAFEGPIGTGKTSLAKEAAQILGSRLLLERFEENEYLADYYREPDRFAVQMQLTFLVDRHRQFQVSDRSACDPMVSDFTFEKDRLFAGMLLKGRDLRLYEQIREALATLPKQPDIVVYLDASTDVLMTRIAQRSRSYEQSIQPEYLDAQRSAYRTHFNQRTLRKLWVDTGMNDYRGTRMGELIGLISLSLS